MPVRRILSGTRPTGPLHLGNYFGAIIKWVENQNINSYYMIADWHVLTTDYASKKNIKNAVFEVALDLLALGLDPNKCTLFVQSAIPAHAELCLILSMISPIAWLERNPTFKEQLRELEGKELNTLGFLGYPILQAADILLYQADGVPVGEDQLPHLELAREIARRFNHIFGTTFQEPEAILTATPKLPGTDGRKMSKSYGNCISFSDEPEPLEKKVKEMVTDPARKRRQDPGTPEICPVFAYHKIFNAEGAEDISNACRNAKIGCVECKSINLSKLRAYISPVKARRDEFKAKPDFVWDVLNIGNRKAMAVANRTLEAVRKTLQID